VLVALAVGACAAEAGRDGAARPVVPTQAAASMEPVPSARSGVPAPSTRVRFVPASVVLPGGARAAVEPAQTVDTVLAVPENVRHVGWWDGSAYAGDPFGSTVIAGHVDSATQGLGFFARLLRVQRGEVVTLRNGRHLQRYRVTSVRTVAKQALATTSAAFDQTGDHRLVLITCTGAYLPDRGGYQSNLVVIAEPVGAAR
jgi:LPXTG-site transpeptidase (sortase) family protein